MPQTRVNIDSRLDFTTMFKSQNWEGHEACHIPETVKRLIETGVLPKYSEHFWEMSITHSLLTFS